MHTSNEILQKREFKNHFFATLKVNLLACAFTLCHHRLYLLIFRKLSSYHIIISSSYSYTIPKRCNFTWLSGVCGENLICTYILLVDHLAQWYKIDVSLNWKLIDLNVHSWQHLNAINLHIKLTY